MGELEAATGICARMNATDFAVPKQVKLIDVGVDFQIDRCEVEFVGWGEGEETWGLGYFVLPGDFSQMYQKGRPWAFDQIEGILTRQFIREDGALLSVACAGFDTGFAKVQRALYQYLRPRYGRRYFAMKGASIKWAPIWAQGRRDERIRLFIIGTNRAKALIYQRATISIPGPGYMHIPKTDDYSEEWFKQLLAEDSHTERDRGIEMQIFEMPATPNEDSSAHNEALDIRVAATAALYIRGPVSWEMEEKRNLATVPAAGNGAVQNQDRQRRPARRNNLVRSIKQAGW
jgi:phage terminase large subunit GpA-like protein